jgi:demethylmacrocin O-methyltransferase
MKLIDLFKKYPSKGKLHFLKIYDDYFKNFKNKKINILEIGVHEGKSLMIWKDYFPKANIIGIDLKSYNFNINRIFTFQGDQTDINFLLGVSRKFKKFDIIIDDGSHVSSHIIKTFGVLFDFLKEGGLYICEDLQTSYWPRYGGSRINLNKKNTSLSFFKTLVDSGNYESYDRPFYKKSKFDGKIKFVHFFQNLVIIKKGPTNNLQYNNFKLKNKLLDLCKKFISKFYN